MSAGKFLLLGLLIGAMLSPEQANESGSTASAPDAGDNQPAARRTPRTRVIERTIERVVERPRRSAAARAAAVSTPASPPVSQGDEATAGNVAEPVSAASSQEQH